MAPSAKVINQACAAAEHERVNIPRGDNELFRTARSKPPALIKGFHPDRLAQWQRRDAAIDWRDYYPLVVLTAFLHRCQAVIRIGPGQQRAK